MPGLDRSGPEGRGSRTGRAQGNCTSNVEFNQESGFGRGMGKRCGFQSGNQGRGGRRSGAFQANFVNEGARVSAADVENESLKTTVVELQRSLDEMKARMEELETR